MIRLEVGRISRAHGLRGDVIIQFTTDRVDERTRSGSVLYAEGEELVVERGQTHGRTWLVHFRGIDSREAAEELRGLTLSADELDEPATLFVHRLVGKRVVDADGTDFGPVTAVVDNPASDLLELEDGQLVPLTFVVDVGDEEIWVDVPVGLLLPPAT